MEFRDSVVFRLFWLLGGIFVIFIFYAIFNSQITFWILKRESELLKYIENHFRNGFILLRDILRILKIYFVIFDSQKWDRGIRFMNKNIKRFYSLLHFICFNQNTKSIFSYIFLLNSKIQKEFHSLFLISLSLFLIYYWIIRKDEILYILAYFKKRKQK